MICELLAVRGGAAPFFVDDGIGDHRDGGK